MTRRSARARVRARQCHDGAVSTTLRVLTYNIRRLRDDAGAVRDVLAASRADVVAIQEPPRGPWGRRRLRNLAGSAGYRTVVLGGVARTAALLVREGVPCTGERAVRLRWYPTRRSLTRRGFAMADVAGVRVISVHLGLGARQRAGHLITLLQVVTSVTGGCVVAGDLNEDPGGPSWRRLTLHLHDVGVTSAPTFPSDDPRHRIDAVLISRAAVARSVRVLGVDTGAGDVEAGAGAASAGAVGIGLRADVVRRASDHLPVLADLTFP